MRDYLSAHFESLLGGSIKIQHRLATDAYFVAPSVPMALPWDSYPMGLKLHPLERSERNARVKRCAAPKGQGTARSRRQNRSRVVSYRYFSKNIVHQFANAFPPFRIACMRSI